MFVQNPYYHFYVCFDRFYNIEGIDMQRRNDLILYKLNRARKIMLFFLIIKCYIFHK